MAEEKLTVRITKPLPAGLAKRYGEHAVGATLGVSVAAACSLVEHDCAVIVHD